MKFSWTQLQRPILALSPMADMTDAPFNALVKSMASPIIFREMVSAEALRRGSEKTFTMCQIDDSERPAIQQIFGADPQAMADAAKIIEEKFTPSGIDINMGCPVYKMVSNFNGAALMKDPKLAAKIVKAIKQAVSVPVSVKIRAGWSDPNECLTFSKVLESAGADLISIHGRTQAQGYSGKANRQVVREAKKSVSIPVLYNGDIFTWQDFFTAIEETGCDGALIARGALGNPWIFEQIEDHLQNKTPQDVTITERIRIIRDHLDRHLNHYGETSVPTFRKHLSWYFKGIEGIKSFKPALMTAQDRQTLDKVLELILDQKLTET